MTAEKPKPKQLLRPITTGTNSAMNQSQFLATELPETSSKRGKNHAYKVGLVLVLVFRLIGLKNWRESLKPITKRSNRNHVITFDSHLKTALSCRQFVICFTFSLSASCNPPCRNGGVCVGANKCRCSKGFTGDQCLQGNWPCRQVYS